MELGTFLKKHSLVPVDTVGDGNCLFTSFAYQYDKLYNTYPDARNKDVVKHGSAIRRAVVDYTIEHLDDYLNSAVYDRGGTYHQVITEDDQLNTFMEREEEMRRNGTYGEEIELSVLSKLYKVPILIYDTARNKCTYHLPANYYFPGKREADCPEVIYPNTIVLLFNGFNHYDTTRRVLYRDISRGATELTINSRIKYHDDILRKQKLLNIVNVIVNKLPPKTVDDLMMCLIALVKERR